MSNTPVKDSSAIFREIWTDYGNASGEADTHLEIYLAMASAMAGVLFVFGAAVFKMTVFIAVPLAALGLVSFIISARFVLAWSREPGRENKNEK